jgi:hypothetical protein
MSCEAIVGLLSTAVAGMAAAVVVLWRSYRSAVRSLINEKEAKIRLLEGIKQRVQERQKGN